MIGARRRVLLQNRFGAVEMQVIEGDSGGRAETGASGARRRKGRAVDLRQLECFVALIEEASFTVAARRLGLSQPTVSSTVKQLERGVGFELLARRYPPVTLTPAGTVVVEHARAICATVRNLSSALDDLRATQSRTFRVGVFAGGVGRATPLLLESLARVPDVTPEVVTITSSNHQVASLLDKTIDAVLTMGPFTDERIEVTPLFEQPRIAVVGARHELADASLLTVADVADRPKMGLLDGEDAGWADWWTLVPERNGEQAKRVDGFDVDDIIARLRRHAFIDVVTCTPAHIAEYAPAAYFGVRYLPIDGLTPAVAVLLTRRDADPLVRNLVGHAARVARELDARARDLGDVSPPTLRLSR